MGMIGSSQTITDVEDITLNDHPQIEPKFHKPGSCAVFWAETLAVVRYEYRQSYRHPILYLPLLFAVLFGLFVSFIWFQLPDSPTSADAIYRVITLHALYFTSMSNLSGFTSFTSDRRLILPSALRAVRFSAASVWMGRTMSSFPIRLIAITLSCVLIYPIVGLRPGFKNYLFYKMVFILQTFANTALGMSTSAFLPSASLAVWLAVFINTFNYIFSGVPTSINRITWILRWLRFLSPSFYSNQLLIFNQFHDATYPGSAINGNDILKETGWLKIPPSISICALVVLSIVYNVMGGVALSCTSGSNFNKSHN